MLEDDSENNTKIHDYCCIFAAVKSGIRYVFMQSRVTMSNKPALCEVIRPNSDTPWTGAAVRPLSRSRSCLRKHFHVRTCASLSLLHGT